MQPVEKGRAGRACTNMHNSAGRRLVRSCGSEDRWPVWSRGQRSGSADCGQVQSRGPEQRSLGPLIGAVGWAGGAVAQTTGRRGRAGRRSGSAGRGQSRSARSRGLEKWTYDIMYDLLLPKHTISYVVLPSLLRPTYDIVGYTYDDKVLRMGSNLHAGSMQQSR